MRIAALLLLIGWCCWMGPAAAAGKAEIAVAYIRVTAE